MAEAVEFHRVYALQATSQSHQQASKLQESEGALMAAQCAMRDQAQMLANAETEQNGLLLERDTLAHIAQDKATALREGESAFISLRDQAHSGKETLDALITYKDQLEAEGQRLRSELVKLQAANDSLLKKMAEVNASTRDQLTKSSDMFQQTYKALEKAK